MITELPDRTTIQKFTRSSSTHLEPIAKDGVPVKDAPAAGQSYCQWIDVTPEKAATWLKNNFGNRPISDDIVTAYARDMVNGVWVPTHQGIAFNDEDRLIDGQHRLRAIILANKTIRLMVTFNLPSKIDGQEMTTMDCVDRGRTRSVADQLTIQHGFKYGSLTASICAAVSSICCGERTRRLSVGQTLEVYRAFEKSMQFVIEHRSKAHGLKSAGVLAAFAFAHAHLGKKVEQWFFTINAPEADAKYPVLMLLRAFLTSDEAKLISRSLDRGLAEMTLQVLFLEQHGRQVEKLEMSLEGADWFRAQQPAAVKKIAAIFQLPKSVRSEAAAPKHEPIIGREPAPAPAPVKDRPTLERIFSCVENYSKISKFILTGRGRDADIDAARIALVYLARGYGHTVAALALALKKTENVIQEMEVPFTAMTAKQKAAVLAIKAKL